MKLGRKEASRWEKLGDSVNNLLETLERFELQWNEPRQELEPVEDEAEPQVEPEPEEVVPEPVAEANPEEEDVAATEIAESHTSEVDEIEEPVAEFVEAAPKLDRTLPAHQYFSALDWGGTGVVQRPADLGPQPLPSMLGGRSQPASTYFARLPWNGETKIATPVSRKDMAKMMALATRQAVNSAQTAPRPDRATSAKLYFASLDWHKSQRKEA